MDALAKQIDRIAREARLSGVVRIDVAGEVVHAAAYGLADRAHGIANTIDTQFGLASGAKGFTALTVMSLVDEGRLALDTPARSILGTDLPLIDDAVTVEHLLSHRSGIGDYLDEDIDSEPTDYLMPVSVHRLATTADYVAILDGHPQKFPPGDGFSYCNSGFVVLALLAERVTSVPFADLVAERVVRPAGLTATAFLRSDELPGRAARGYLDEGRRTNVFHLPVRGNGDGGIYSTVADLHSLWGALFDGRIVAPATLDRMLRPSGAFPAGELAYGLGFWLDDARTSVSIHGFDPGVTFVSARQRESRYTLTVITNTTRGAWPVSQAIEAVLTAS